MSEPGKKNKVKFTEEEEERIIDFVKSNEVLYNAKHKNFRDSEQKNRLWLRLATELNKDGECICLFVFNFFFRVSWRLMDDLCLLICYK